MIYIPEHKTTTAYKKNGPFRNEYMDSWSPNSQVDGYLYAGHMLYGQNVKELWVDAALVHKQVHDGFKFIPVNRSISMLDGWLYETRFWIEMIQQETEKLKKLRDSGDSNNLSFLPAFPKNTGACFHYAGCPYRDICKMVNNPEHYDEPPMGYKEEHWSPFDVLELEKIGMPAEDS